MGQVKVFVDYKHRAGQLFGKGVTHIDAEHQIGRVVPAPGSGVVDVVLGIERVVSDEAVEQTALDREPVAHRRQIGEVGAPEVPELIRSADLGFVRGKAEVFGILPAVAHEFHAPARLLRGVFPDKGPCHVQVEFVDPRRRASVADPMIGGKVKVERISQIHEPPVVPVLVLSFVLLLRGAKTSPVYPLPGLLP